MKWIAEWVTYDGEKQRPEFKTQMAAEMFAVGFQMVSGKVVNVLMVAEESDLICSG